MKEQCRGLVWREYTHTRCRCTGTLEHEGKWYCKKHHPPTVEAEKTAKQERWRAEWAEDERKRKAAKREQALKDRALEWMRRENPGVIKEWEMEL